MAGDRLSETSAERWASEAVCVPFRQPRASPGEGRADNWPQRFQTIKGRENRFSDLEIKSDFEKRRFIKEWRQKQV